MFGLPEREEPRRPPPPRASLTVKNRETQKQAQRNHMKAVLAWISRHRFSLSEEPQPIQLLERPAFLRLPQLGAPSLAAKTMALIKVKRVARPSRTRRTMTMLRLEMMAAATPYKLATHERAATNIVKLMVAIWPLLLLAMTFPMSAVMSSVQRRPTVRTMAFMKPYMVRERLSW